MKTKHIAALITFFVALGFSTFLTKLVLPNHQPRPLFARHQRGDRTQQKIYRLLQQDIRNGQERLDQFYHSEDGALTTSERRLAAYAKAVNEYADRSASLDDSNLPREFQIAWRAHMQAWRDQSDFLNQADENSLFTNDFRHVYKEQDAKISQTWYETLRIADRYNARPFNAY